MSARPGGADDALLRRLAAAPASETRRLLIEATCAYTAEFLGLPDERRPGPGAVFLDLGFDSIRAVDFKVLLEERLACRLRSTVLFDCPTPEALVDHLLAALAEREAPLPLPATPAEREARVDPAELDVDQLRHELERERARLRSLDEARSEPLAIVGLSCRFPGADDPEAFWELQAGGGDAVRDVPADRWDNDALFDADRDAPGKVYTRQAGFLNRVDGFDARFFGIAPREAHQLDPQQRLLLEVTWEALERAGIAPDALQGSPTGVFVGTRGVEYVTGQSDRSLEDADTYFGTGNSISTMAGRISYVFGLTGPCYALDTACSSALVALHEACQSLRRGECSLAIAGAVNMLLDPFASVALCRAHMLSPDDRCRTFDAGANGYVRGEGCGMLVIKRLSRAQADGDRILALIRGTAINQDGASGGLTVPSGAAQQAVVRQALANGRVQPGEVDFIEAHGTGTSLGDPIEVAALDAVFGPGRPPDRPLVVGSVKTNIGHLESAAGIAGLIKVVQMFEHGSVPPHLHLSEPNPHIPWDETIVEIPTTPRPWPRSERPRLAGVSSFGFSGTNAHVVLEEAPEPAAVTPRPRPRELVVLAAGDDQALAEQVAHLGHHLRAHPELALGDVAATLATGRSQRAHRLAFLARDRDELQEQLGDPGRHAVADGRAPAAPPRVAFLFTGQGSQQLGMARQLARSEPAFAATLAACAAVLDEQLERPLLQLIWGDDEALLRRTDHAQPALFAVGVALGRLWQSWGVEPTWVAGHSVGEYAAAVLAGVLSLEDGARLIAARGRLMVEHTRPGAMLAVDADPATLEPLLAGREEQLSMAALNAPSSVVLSGTHEAIADVQRRLEADGRRCRALEVSHAFHSPLMDPMLAPFRERFEGVELGTPRVGFVSGLSGVAERDALRDPDYWVRHVREPVRFDAAAATVLAQGCDVLIEIGPSPTLTALGRRQAAAAEHLWLASLRPGQDDDEVLLSSLARAWVAGVPVDWSAVHRGRGTRPVVLPTYAFQRERFWLQRRGRLPGVPTEGHAHPLLGRPLDSAGLPEGRRVFEVLLADGAPAWLADHAVHESTVTPAAGYVEWALAAARQAGLDGPLAVEPLEVVAALVPGAAGSRVQAVIDEQDGAVALALHARAADAGDDAPWELHARARVVPLDAADSAPPAVDLTALERRCTDLQDVDGFYDLYDEVGLRYGPAFRGLVALARGTDEALATVVLPEAAPEDPAYQLHPSLLDACFQACRTVSLARDLHEMYLPLGIDRVVRLAAPERELRCHLRLAQVSDDGRSLVFDLDLLDAHGVPRVLVRGLRMVQASRSALLAATDPLRTLGHVVNWVGAERQSQADGSAAGRWLVLADDAGAGATLAGELELRGGQPLAASRLVLPLDDPRAWAAVLDELNDPHRPCRGIVHLWSLDGADDAAALGASVLRMVQSLAVAPVRTPPRIYLVTRGAVPASGLPERVDVDAASLWGLGGCLAFEHPEWRTTRVDLDPLGGEDDLRRLCDELLADDPETQLAWRGGMRRVARLDRLARAPAPGLELPEDGPWRLGVTSYGVLDHLTALPHARRAPGPGEVEVQLTHGALNFKDVLFALGLLAEWSGIRHAPDQLLGLEGAGRVLAVGADVADLSPGQTVMVSAAGCLASHVTTRREAVVPLPDGIDAATGAAVQTIFLTALYALQERAGLGAGQRVLIHAAAGGVGQAAIAVARRIGATIYATASPGKWRLLESQGVTVVGSTRDLRFADRLGELTGGRGVDVVLNSLAGEAIGASLGLVAEGGHFVDIGKLGTWSAEQVATERADVRYHHFDMAEVLGDDPALLARLMDALVAGLSDGSLTAPALRVLEVGQAPAAFALLAASRTVGKLVLSFPEREATPRVRADRSYLVTGGLGGLGRGLGRWLAEQGAGRVVLCGRRGPDADTAAELARWPGRVEGCSLDVTDGDAVRQLVASLDPPLAGVFHAAGMLGDGMLVNQEADNLAAVLAPKLTGARHLDAATADIELDHFVLFSSMVAMVGAQGQGPYGAANAALDALAGERRARGLPGLSIAWGPWAGEGMASTTADINRGRFLDLGIGSIGPEQGLAALGRLMDGAPPHVGVLPVTWSRFLAAFAPGQRPPYLDTLQAGRGGDDERGDPILGQLSEAPPGERRQLLLSYVSGQLARVMGHASADAVDPAQEFVDMGVDSLLAVDLRNRLEAALDLSLPATLLFDHPSVRQVVAHLDALLERSWQDEDALLEEIEGLSPEDVERLLLGDEHE